jgi:hypothetical protein
MTTPPERVANIRRLWQAGHATREIARLARTSQSTASRYIRQFEAERAAKPSVGPGENTILLTCIGCWCRYHALPERVAALFCPTCER